MFCGSRVVRNRPVLAGAVLLALLPFAAAGQEMASPAAAPGVPPAGDAPSAALPAVALPVVDPQLDAAMPDIDVAWPDMGAADSVTPIAPQPGDAVETAVPPPIDAGPGSEAEAPEPVLADSGADQKYRVVLNGLDGVADDAFMLRFNELSVLKQDQNRAANLAQINRRIKEDGKLLDTLLRARGYYAARIRGNVAPPVGDDRLRATFDIALGAQYVLASVDIAGLGDTGARAPKLREAFNVEVDDPVDADRITAAQASLRTALGENGFPFAKVDDPEVRIDHDTRKGDLDIIVTSGGYRSFGAIRMENEEIFSATHVQRIARFRPGDTYEASEVDDLRRALVATGLVSSVTLKPKDAGDGQHVDIGVDVSPAPFRTIAGEIGYGTGEGYRLEGSWQHRNFFPPEGGITLRGVAGTQEQLASVTYRRGNFRKRDQVLTALFSAGNLNRDAYDARTITLAASLERQTNILFQKKWIWSIGAELVASDERDSFSKVAGGGRRSYLIGAAPVSLTYDGSDNLLDPTTGFRLGGRISPEVSFQDSVFSYVRTQIDGSYYRPMGDRLVLAGRVRLGSILGSKSSRIAPSRRFYAGGGGSVRGYGFQDIGPRDVNNDPMGGKSLSEFSLEARMRFGHFGVVPFVDAGNISSAFLPKFDNLRIGAGVGVRYYSSFGPIRVDVGTPINPDKGDPPVAVYVSLGQAF